MKKRTVKKAKKTINTPKPEAITEAEEAMADAILNESTDTAAEPQPEAITEEEEAMADAILNESTDTDSAAEETTSAAANTPKQNKLKKMEQLLTGESGKPLKELASELGWLPNSVRGAMSLFAKNHKEYKLVSEKRDGIRTYKLVSAD